MRKVTIAATQMACTDTIEENIRKAEQNIRTAAAQGAHIVLLQELFSGPYFCQDEDKRFLSLAREAEGHPMLRQMAALARELAVVLPVSFF